MMSHTLCLTTKHCTSFVCYLSNLFLFFARENTQHLCNAHILWFCGCVVALLCQCLNISSLSIVSHTVYYLQVWVGVLWLTLTTKTVSGRVTVSLLDYPTHLEPFHSLYSHYIGDSLTETLPYLMQSQDVTLLFVYLKCCTIQYCRFKMEYNSVPNLATVEFQPCIQDTLHTL